MASKRGPGRPRGRQFSGHLALLGGAELRRCLRPVCGACGRRASRAASSSSAWVPPPRPGRFQPARARRLPPRAPRRPARGRAGGSWEPPARACPSALGSLLGRLAVRRGGCGGRGACGLAAALAAPRASAGLLLRVAGVCRRRRLAGLGLASARFRPRPLPRALSASTASASASRLWRGRPFLTGGLRVGFSASPSAVIGLSALAVPPSERRVGNAVHHALDANLRLLADQAGGVADDDPQARRACPRRR